MEAPFENIIEAEGGHWHWAGRRGRVHKLTRERPVWRGHGFRVYPEKDFYERVYGVEVGSQRFRRECDDEPCIRPEHHKPAAPGKLLKVLVPDVDVRTAICCQMRAEARSGAYTLSGTAGLEPDTARELAERFRVPVLAVLAAHARLAREAARG